MSSFVMQPCRGAAHRLRLCFGHRSRPFLLASVQGSGALPCAGMCFSVNIPARRVGVGVLLFVRTHLGLNGRLQLDGTVTLLYNVSAQLGYTSCLTQVLALFPCTVQLGEAETLRWTKGKDGVCESLFVGLQVVFAVV